MTDFQPFVMERMMSLHEQAVDYNLSESGVHPMTLGELLDLAPEAAKDLGGTSLNYPHVNGIPQLRENIAAMYPGATQDNVLVTVGAIEANFVSLQTLAARGERVVVMLPNYMQIWGAAKNHGLSVETFRLLQEDDWAPDIDELSSKVDSETKLIAVCNPNNPTGKILSEKDMNAIVTEAARVGAWILADEVYSGAERLVEAETPSFWGRYPKVVAVGSMSKAYGLPGLRVGWVVAPRETIDEIWARHEYTTLAATMLSNRLAAIALSPDVRPKILRRTREHLLRGFVVLEDWIAAHTGILSLTPPDAAAIAFVRYELDVGSTQFVERLRNEQSVLMVPGDHFGMDRFLRISFGLPEDYLALALARTDKLIQDLSN